MLLAAGLAQRVAGLVSAARRQAQPLADSRSRRQARAHRQLHQLWRGGGTRPRHVDGMEAVRSAGRDRGRGEHSCGREDGWPGVPRSACSTTPIRKPANRFARSSTRSAMNSACTYHGVRYRTTGYRQIIEVHLLFPHATAVGEAHRLATALEERLPAELGTARRSDYASGIARRPRRRARDGALHGKARVVEDCCQSLHESRSQNVSISGALNRRLHC